MKVTAVSENVEIVVELTNQPTAVFEELEVATKDSNKQLFIAAGHTWNHLTTTSDLTPLYEQTFTMSNDEWLIMGCMVLKDGSIYFNSASMVVAEPA